MRIVLTGTHSTGKTGLVNRLAMQPEFKGYHASYSNTRALKSQGLPINCDKGEDFTTTQDLVLTFHLKDLLRPNLIADRCLLDGLAYTQFLTTKGLVDNLTLELFGQLSGAFLHEYDFIFYSPIRDKIIDDGVRSTDESFRLGVDLLLKEKLLPSISQKVYTLPSKDMMENMKFIMDIVFPKKKSLLNKVIKL